MVNFEFCTESLLFEIQKLAMTIELNTRTMEGSYVSFVQKLLLSNDGRELKCCALIQNGGQIASCACVNDCHKLLIRI